MEFRNNNEYIQEAQTAKVATGVLGPNEDIKYSTKGSCRIYGHFGEWEVDIAIICSSGWGLRWIDNVLIADILLSDTMEMQECSIREKVVLNSNFYRWRFRSFPVLSLGSDGMLGIYLFMLSLSYYRMEVMQRWRV